jgi:hypothetical protein
MSTILNRFMTGSLAIVLCLAWRANAASAAAGNPVVLHVGLVARQDVGSQPQLQNDTMVEPDVAVSPVDPRIAVAVAQDGRFSNGDAADISYSWTHDAGAHWHQAPMPGLTRTVGGTYDRATDPVVAFGPDGSVYVSDLLYASDCRNAIAVSRSTDGGRTFAPPVYAQRVRDCSDDKDWIVADTGAASPHRGRIYVFWARYSSDSAAYSPQELRWSDDQGRTWSATHLVTGRKRYVANSQPIIRPDGSLVDTYVDYTNEVNYNGGPRIPVEPIYARTSTDGGATWGPQYLVANGEIAGTPDIRSGGDNATVDAVTGTMYVVWTGIGPGNTIPVEITSSDDGVNWSAPVRVTRGDVPGVERINADVAARGGKVYVSYGTRTHADQNGGYVRQQLSYSGNGARSFGRPLSIGRRSVLRYGAHSGDGSYFPGDYIGSAIAPGHLYVVWPRASKPPAGSTSPYHQVIDGAALHT